MSDLAKWKVHGPVEALRTDFATWDLNQEDWQPVQHFTVASFRPDGTISTSDTHNADGSIAHSRWLYNDAGRLTEVSSCLNDGPISRAVYFYDEAGRHLRTAQLSHDSIQTDSEICSYDAQGKRTKVRFLGPGGANAAYGIEGTDMAWGAPGAMMMTITYDVKDLPTKVLFQDANHNLLRYVMFMRASAGNLLNVELHVGGESLFQELADKAPPEGREGMAAMLKQAFGESFSSTTYVYDTQGRLIERTHGMGSLGGDRTVYHYDDYDNPIEEITEHTDREASFDETGTVYYSSDRLNIQHNQFEYRYDAHGNWTERIVSIRVEPNPSFQRSNIEHRSITYHAARLK